MVVENRAGRGRQRGHGGGGELAARRLHAPHELCGHACHQWLRCTRSCPSIPSKDFAPVATLATLPFVVVTRPDAPFKTMPELVDAAKTGRVNYGSAGNGSVNHLLGEMFNTAAGVKLVHVPYRGAAPAHAGPDGRPDRPGVHQPALGGGRHQAGHAASRSRSPARKRAASFSQIPTIAEAGFRDFDVNPWFGLFAPASVTPRGADPQDQRRRQRSAALAGRGRQVRGTGRRALRDAADEFGALLNADIVKWGHVVKASGASVD